MTVATDIEPGAVGFLDEGPAWTAEAARRRAADDAPLSEADEAYFWWGSLVDGLTHKAAMATKWLKATPWWAKLEAELNEEAPPKTPEAVRALLCFAWLARESDFDLVYCPPVEAYREIGQAYIEHTTDKELTDRENVDRAAARFLVEYAHFLDLMGGFVMPEGPAPCSPSVAVVARGMRLCERLGALGEAFSPEQGGPDPALLDVREGLRHRARKATRAAIAKAMGWTPPDGI